MCLGGLEIRLPFETLLVFGIRRSKKMRVSHGASRMFMRLARPRLLSVPSTLHFWQVLCLKLCFSLQASAIFQVVVLEKLGRRSKHSCFGSVGGNENLPLARGILYWRELGEPRNWLCVRSNRQSGCVGRIRINNPLETFHGFRFCERKTW